MTSLETNPQPKPTQAEAQRWCFANGITPTEAEAQRQMTRLLWATAEEHASMPELAEKSRMIGFALGWDDAQ